MAQNDRLDGHPRLAMVAVQTDISCHTFLCVAQGNQSMRSSSIECDGGITWSQCLLYLHTLHCTDGDQWSLCQYVSSHDFATQSSHSVDLAGWQAKMASSEIWIQSRNAHKPRSPKQPGFRQLKSQIFRESFPHIVLPMQKCHSGEHLQESKN